jgi:hypothetical protein
METYHSSRSVQARRVCRVPLYSTGYGLDSNQTAEQSITLDKARRIAMGRPGLRGPVSERRICERQNIAHYAEQLKTEPDMNKRKMLEQLLVEEKAKQAKSRESGRCKPVRLRRWWSHSGAPTVFAIAQQLG